jgi:SAM-dependent methyltransferase
MPISTPRPDLGQVFAAYGEYYVSHHYYQLTRLEHRDPLEGALLGEVRSTDDFLDAGSRTGLMALEASRLARSSAAVLFTARDLHAATQLRELEEAHLRLIEGYERTPLHGERLAGAELVLGEPGRLPFADARFSLIACRQLPAAPRDAEALLDEMLRCVRPGGRILLNAAEAGSSAEGSGAAAGRWLASRSLTATPLETGQPEGGASGHVSLPWSEKGKQASGWLVVQRA